MSFVTVRIAWRLFLNGIVYFHESILHWIVAFAIMALRRFILKTYSITAIYLEGGSKKVHVAFWHVSLVIQTTIWSVCVDYRQTCPVIIQLAQVFCWSFSPEILVKIYSDNLRMNVQTWGLQIHYLSWIAMWDEWCYDGSHVGRMVLAGVGLASRTLLSPCLGCCFGP